jgi:hypothetical protein
MMSQERAEKRVTKAWGGCNKAGVTTKWKVGGTYIFIVLLTDTHVEKAREKKPGKRKAKPSFHTHPKSNRDGREGNKRYEHFAASIAFILLLPPPIPSNLA